MSENLLQPTLPRTPGDHIHWGQLYGAAASLALVSAAQKSTGILLVITADNHSAQQLYDELVFFKSTTQEVLLFPDWETLPYDVFSPHEDIISERLTVLARLPQLTSGILIVPAATLMYPVMPRAYLDAHSLLLQTGQVVPLETMRNNLTKAGYRYVEQVMGHGEFALRGAILDLFPMGSELPYRIDLLGDEIDTIRTFDPKTQRSIVTLPSVKLLPAKEFPLTDASIAQFRQAWREAFAGRPMDCPIYEAVSSGVSPAGVEYYLPLFYETVGTIFDYLPAKTTLVHWGDSVQAAQQFWLGVMQRYEQYRHDVSRPLLPPHLLFMPVERLFQFCKQQAQITVQMKPCDIKQGNFNFATQPLPDVALDPNIKTPLMALRSYLQFNLQSDVQTQGRRVLLTAETAGRREVMIDLLRAVDIRPKAIESWSTFLNGHESFAITIGSMEQGLNVDNPALIVITEAQLYGQRVLQRRLRKAGQIDEQHFIRSLVELRPGVPVVHIDHGVGRYLGLEIITTSGITTASRITTEFVALAYANETKLYIPVADLHLLSRYGGSDPDHAPLHTLGAEHWSKAKQKAAEKARDVAAELLDLYARRAARPGRPCAAPDENYKAFAAGFAFEETPDQQKAIEAVLADMVQQHCMDRLICGDVGFGKTEVAMRAAFLAVQSHYQVAILVPTTLLAEQHYQSFKDRFASWPVNIELISRFRSAKEQTEVLKTLAQGQVDIIIGTHKLLQDSIKFSNLGLLVIDEEHRFGVKQKERLKALRTDVNILTLTATPIPRTLNMSLSGVRSLSLITTPPARRLSVKTFVQTRNNNVLREAILREILRGGQVYFLHNDVATIELTARELEKLVPEAKVGIGHGQLAERELERVMADFYHQRFNVLVCTTIIETGIDIPSANTIIMDRADKLGLAQLHQLRGRVGRSHHQAYAYLLIPDPKLITPDAQKRLDAISSAEDLGAGFILASYDLEIRGAGELLGEEQTGHIATVGFSLYLEFLDKAVAALKAGKQPDFNKPLIEHTDVDLSMSALISTDYIFDVNMRLVLYKRIAAAKDEHELKDLQVEMIDRFGLLPQEAQHLFAIAELKMQMRVLGITRLQAGELGGFMEFSADPKIDPRKMIELIQQKSRIYKLQGPKKLSFTIPTETPEKRLTMIRLLLELLR